MSIPDVYEWHPTEENGEWEKKGINYFDYCCQPKSEFLYS